MKHVTAATTLAAILSVGMAIADDKVDTKHPIFGQKMKSLTGKTVDLKDYRGKVLLIVNTASECGATPQYETLQLLHEALNKRGLVVMGFPCNQFGAQEPGTGKEIATFCKKNYGVEFSMFGKVDVNGKGSPALFKHLTSEKNGLKDAGPVKWNFEKFLVSREGKVVARFRTGVEPDADEVVDAIVAELKKDVPKEDVTPKTDKK
jgi:glutathione peroxidase